MTERTKHIIFGILILMGAGILFMPLLWNKMVWNTSPLAMPERPAWSGPQPFVADVTAQAVSITQQVMSQRQQAVSPKAAGTVPTPAWTIRLQVPARLSMTTLVSQLRARGYFAYIDEDVKGEPQLFVGPDIKKQRSEQLLMTLHQTLQLDGQVEQYIP